jgi:hypothetical protein
MENKKEFMFLYLDTARKYQAGTRARKYEHGSNQFESRQSNLKQCRRDSTYRMEKAKREIAVACVRRDLFGTEQLQHSHPLTLSHNWPHYET